MPWSRCWVKENRANRPPVTNVEDSRLATFFLGFSNRKDWHRAFTLFSYSASDFFNLVLHPWEEHNYQQPHLATAECELDH